MSNRMESIVARSAGKLKGFRARLDGLVGVFRTLAEQHGQVSVLLRHLQQRPDKRSDLWPEIRRELLSHERAEMREVYPELREHVQTRALAVQHDQEATQLEALIDEIDTTRSEAWRPLYDRLVELVQHHADEEEKEIFPRAQQIIGVPLTKDLDAKFLVMQKKLAAGLD